MLWCILSARPTGQADTWIVWLAGFDSQPWYQELFTFGMEEEQANGHAGSDNSDADLVPRLVSQVCKLELLGTMVASQQDGIMPAMRCSFRASFLAWADAHC